MTFPVTQAVSRGSAGSATSRNIPLPTPIAAGDLLLAILATNTGATVTWDQTTAGAWTLLESTVYSTYCRITAYWKIADGSESGLTLSVATSAIAVSAWQVYRFSNAQSVEAGVAVTAYDRFGNPPNLAPSWGADDVTWLTPLVVANPDATPNDPSSYANQLWDTTSGIGLATSRRDLNTASENPGTWAVHPLSNRRNIAQTYAICGGTTAIQPPRLNTGVTFYGPQVNLGLVASRLDAGVTLFAPSIAYDQEIAAPLLEAGVTFYGPKMITGVGPPRLDLQVTLYGPTIVRELHNLEPPRLEIGARFFRPLVTGGTRTPATFTDLAIGPFPGSIGDLAIYSGSNQGAAFEQRWATRGPLGFGDYAPFVAGEYEFENASVWLRLEVEAVERVFAITRTKLNVDVPDVIDSQEVDLPEGGAWVNFTRTFYQPPNVVAQVIAAAEVTTVPRVTVRDDIEATRAFVIPHYGDDTTDSVAARVKIIATGY